MIVYNVTARYGGWDEEDFSLGIYSTESKAISTVYKFAREDNTNESISAWISEYEVDVGGKIIHKYKIRYSQVEEIDK